MRGFKLIRTDAAKMTVSSYHIVEVINVFGQIKCSCFAISINALLDALFL